MRVGPATWRGYESALFNHSFDGAHRIGTLCIGAYYRTVAWFRANAADQMITGSASDMPLAIAAAARDRLLQQRLFQ